MTEQYFRPRKWEDYQPVRERSAKYIRNYPELLDDDKYLSLAVSERSLLHGIWMLCGTLGRSLPLSSSFLGRRLGLPSQVVGRALKVLVACNYLEICTKDCKLRSETVAPRVESREKRVERKKNSKVTPASPCGYEFEGEFIKLNKKDFDEWNKAFDCLSLRAELIAIDGLISGWPASDQKKWFFKLSSILAKRNREAGIERERAKAAAVRPEKRYAI